MYHTTAQLQLLTMKQITTDSTIQFYLNRYFVKAYQKVSKEIYGDHYRRMYSLSSNGQSQMCIENFFESIQSTYFNW